MAENTVVTQPAVNSLAGKFRTFIQGLPEQEQDVLSWLLARATSASTGGLSDAQIEDLARDYDTTPLSTILAQSVGLGGSGLGLTGSEITAGWKYSWS